MIEFRTTLQNKLLDLTKSWVGTGTNPQNFIRTFDNHLHDVELTEMPFLVVNVRTMEDFDEGEIGFARFGDQYSWLVHLYYLDLTELYNPGDERRNLLLGKISRELMADPRLDNVSYSDTTSNIREYVYDSKLTTVLWDSSGQENYWSFVSEMYLNVYTDKCHES